MCTVLGPALLALSGCAPAATAGDAGECPACRDAAPSGDAADAAPAGCPPLASVGDGGAGALSLYPEPRFAEVGAGLAAVRTACVDTGALPAHQKLDALVSGVLSEAGLAQAPLGDCGCDWTLRFGAPPTLDPAAQAVFDAGQGNPELYAAVTTLRGGRPLTSLYASGERGGLFALRAALATLGAGVLPQATIVDWPEIRSRGFLDGIYGTLGKYPGGFASWPSKFTPATRAEIVRLVSRLRGNTFIYGPKCDDYARGGTCGQPASPNWSTTYPKGNGQQSSIQTLATECDDNLIDLYWAVNPVVSFDWANPDVNAIEAKIDQVRALGVRHFAMFVDDSSGKGGTAAQDAAVMNQIDAYLRTVDPNDHLLVVTWAYNGYWSTSSQKGFGGALDPNVEVMWTGPGIESCGITAQQMAGPNQNYARTLSLWDNWPSNTCDPPWPPQPTETKMVGRSGDLPSAIRGYYHNPVISEAGNPLDAELAHLGPVFDFAWGAAHYAADVDASYARWGAIRAGWQALVHPCATTTCMANGGPYQGFACDVDKMHILFCDQYDTPKNCVTRLRCPKGCTVQDNLQDTCD